MCSCHKWHNSWRKFPKYKLERDMMRPHTSWSVSYVKYYDIVKLQNSLTSVSCPCVSVMDALHIRIINMVNYETFILTSRSLLIKCLIQLAYQWSCNEIYHLTTLHFWPKITHAWLILKFELIITRHKGQWREVNQVCKVLLIRAPAVTYAYCARVWQGT